jgi:hypothetical protein
VAQNMMFLKTAKVSVALFTTGVCIIIGASRADANAEKLDGYLRAKFGMTWEQIRSEYPDTTQRYRVNQTSGIRAAAVRNITVDDEDLRVEYQFPVNDRLTRVEITNMRWLKISDLDECVEVWEWLSRETHKRHGAPNRQENRPWSTGGRVSVNGWSFADGSGIRTIMMFSPASRVGSRCLVHADYESRDFRETR